MALLLRQELEPVFLHPSHGFRMARGTKTFFQDIFNWPEMDYLIQCDVVKCFDRIRHDLLLPLLRECFGPENEDFIKLIHAFLTTDIYDKYKKNKNYACLEVGISPISPVLMNVFLHQLDLRMAGKNIGMLDPEGQYLQHVRIYYERYAEDMLFGVARIKMYCWVQHSPLVVRFF